MATPAFRESGKPRPGKSSSANGTNVSILPAPGAGRAYVVYDILWMNPSAEAGLSRLREHSGSEANGETASQTDGTIMTFLFGDTSWNLSSPIQASENKGLMSEVGYITITYEIISV